MSEFIDEFGEKAPSNVLQIYYTEVKETRRYNGKLLCRVDDTAHTIEWSVDFSSNVIKLRSLDANRSFIFDHIDKIQGYIMEQIYSFIKSREGNAKQLSIKNYQTEVAS